jgi:hypothetical protein
VRAAHSGAGHHVRPAQLDTLLAEIEDPKRSAGKLNFREDASRIRCNPSIFAPISVCRFVPPAVDVHFGSSGLMM